MAIPSAQNLWNITDKEILRVLDSPMPSREPRTVHFYAPNFMSYKAEYSSSLKGSFPTISITGNNCTLNCKHCEGKILHTMQPATNPNQLLTLCTKLKQEGALGCLISGGCLPNGSVPLEPFLPTFAKIKHDLGLTIFVHTGIISLEVAKILKTAGVDAALIDIIGDDQTIHHTYNLNITTRNYNDSLKALHDAKMLFVPHVIVGLNNGKLNGEFNALSMISKFNPSAIVIIAFLPVPGTSMARTNPPQAIDIARTIATARAMFPKTPLVLGCMRPKGKTRKETELLSLKAGVNAIAYPLDSTIEYAKNHEYVIKFSPLCCANIYNDLSLKSS
jgi:lipoyl synthase